MNKSGAQHFMGSLIKRPAFSFANPPVGPYESRPLFCLASFSGFRFYVPDVQQGNRKGQGRQGRKGEVYPVCPSDAMYAHVVFGHCPPGGFENKRKRQISWPRCSPGRAWRRCCCWRVNCTARASLDRYGVVGLPTYIILTPRAVAGGTVRL